MLSKKSSRKVKRYLKWRTLIWGIGFVFSALYVTFTYIYIPNALNFATSTYADGLNVDLTTEGWSVDWSDATFSTENLIINTDMSDKPLVRVPKISVDFSVWRLIANEGWKQSINSMHIEKPQLYLERNRSGTWNYDEIFQNRHVSALAEQSFDATSNQANPEDQSASRSDLNVTPVSHQAGFQNALNSSTSNIDADIEASDVVILDKIRITGMKVNWIEALTGQSMGSIVTESKATIHIDDADFTITNVRWPYDSNDAEGQRIAFEGRIGNGQVSVAAKGNMLSWAVPEGAQVYRFEDLVWSPGLTGELSIDNVGADVLAQLIPEPTIIATRGTMTGGARINLQNGSLLALSANIDMRSVQYMTVEGAPTAGRKAVARSIVEANGFASSNFEGDLNDPEFRPFSLMLASVTEDSMRSADPKIQLLAAKQTASLQKGLTPISMQRMKDQRPESIQAAVGTLIGHKLNDKLDGALGTHGAALVGDMAAQTLGEENSGGSTVGKAVKGTGKAIGNAGKKTFGWFKNIGKKD